MRLSVDYAKVIRRVCMFGRLPGIYWQEGMSILASMRGGNKPHSSSNINKKNMKAVYSSRATGCFKDYLTRQVAEGRGSTLEDVILIWWTQNQSGTSHQYGVSRVKFSEDEDPPLQSIFVKHAQTKGSDSTSDFVRKQVCERPNTNYYSIISNFIFVFATNYVYIC